MEKAAMKKVRLSLSVSDTHLGDIKKVVKAAKKAGMSVEAQHESLGVVTGSIDADKLAALQRVAGVGHVEEERKVGIAPPDRQVQ
jgi:hypothetical protein